ncbi:hypothetical protein BKA81DRAFT_218295 [Phyllosticta paracitricarpa]
MSLYCPRLARVETNRRTASSRCHPSALSEEYVFLFLGPVSRHSTDHCAGSEVLRSWSGPAEELRLPTLRHLINQAQTFPQTHSFPHTYHSWNIHGQVNHFVVSVNNTQGVSFHCCPPFRYYRSEHVLAKLWQYLSALVVVRLFAAADGNVLYLSTVFLLPLSP